MEVEYCYLWTSIDEGYYYYTEFSVISFLTTHIDTYTQMHTMCYVCVFCTI